MSVPPGLEPDRVEQLRRATGSDPAPAAPARATPKQQAKRVVRGVLNRALGWYLRGEVDRAVAEHVGQIHHVVAELERVADQHAELLALPVNFELLKGEVAALHATTVNLELLKGEVRDVKAVLEDLGMALAPGAGLAAAGSRVAELREKVNAVERRLRSSGAAPAGDGPAAPPAARAEAESKASSELFDYVGFERRFRGDPDEVIAVLDQRYGELLAAHGPVADLGCGRGELLAAVAARGAEVVGCDTDTGMVAEARGRGLEVAHADALTFLRDAAPGSLGSVITTHVFEHLELDYLIEVLELCVSRLRPGGIMIAETPNPASLIVLGNSYILDPTHVWPLHPSLLAFLCEGAGFRDVRLQFHSPATAYHLDLIDDPDAPEWVATVNAGFQRLNETLFGAQEYAVVATTAEG
jgi:2-polyprenyl-3-methyl-5-hydroxy-6-metoxy-1,4-benzoquinol methylase